MVLTYTSIGPVPLGTSVLNIIQSGETLTTYSNKNVLRIPEYSNTALATSLVGWFYLVGGGLLVVIGMFLFVAFFDFIWNHMRWYRLRMLPAAQALILMWLLFVSSEGTIDSQGYFLVVILTSLLFCEWLMKRIEHSIKRI
jgi:hypothetical protein